MTDIKMPKFPSVQVPLIDADIDLMDIMTLARWCKLVARDYAREAVRLNVPAEFDALVADAARYRWLRDRWGRVTETYDGDSGRVVEIGTEPDGEGWDVDASSLDSAIDAAMQRN